MATDGGQTEINESNPQLQKEASSVQKLQTVLHSKRFQRIANAHRVLEMTRHSQNLLRFFPDQGISVGDIRNETVIDQENRKIIEAPVLRLDDKQKNELAAEANGGRDLVEGAFLYVAEYKSLGEGIDFRIGHSIRGNPMPLSLSPRTVDEKALSLMDYEISFRGLLIKMSGNFSGDRVLLVDSGKSRWLYDWYIMHGKKDEFMQRVISGLNRSPYGLTPSGNNSRLTVCDHDYNIELSISLNPEQNPTQLQKPANPNIR